ncbi:MAG: BspA family leucine-rich repeat surface protein [Clostridiales bacterium]|nr:BspA family leucine-rich repeat surface protein [Clostridiales bacterium]
MINYSNNDVIVAPDGKWLNYGIVPIRYKIICTSSGHGSISAIPSRGITGSSSVLSNNPDYGYKLDSYTLISGTGASLDGNIVTIGTSDVTVRGDFVDKYNPLDLPQNTIRVVTNDGNPPAKDEYTSYETATLVAGTDNVYDVYKSGDSMGWVLRGAYNVTAVLGANISGVTNTHGMFYECTHLQDVPSMDTSSVTIAHHMFYKCIRLREIPELDTHNMREMDGMFWDCQVITLIPELDTSSCVNMNSMMSGCNSLVEVSLTDTSNVTGMNYMFNECYSLPEIPEINTSNVIIMNYTFSECHSITKVPLLDTSKVVDFNYAFSNCYNVESGAYDLYYQASHQMNVPTTHHGTFNNCGSNTTSGAAELAQIPSGWK